MKILTWILTLTLVMLVCTVTLASAAERETYYSDLICSELYNGTTEGLPSGLRPDCQTAFVVMEFDWATRTKHYECIGQSLVYAEETKKSPVCVLLARNDDELAFGMSIDLSPFGIKLVVIDTRPWDPIEE
jgi:hypothetical protein